MNHKTSLQGIFKKCLVIYFTVIHWWIFFFEREVKSGPTELGCSNVLTDVQVAPNLTFLEER